MDFSYICYREHTCSYGTNLILAGATAGVSVRGAAPASLETDLLSSHRTVQEINAVMLSGGSAFGLAAAGGVMQWLQERGVGFGVGDIKVPIVCGASIFDLSVGSNSHPDIVMGYAACQASADTMTTGNVGAGTGASVGKLLGADLAMKGGLGASSFTHDNLVVTAIVVVNAVGNVVDRDTGQILAGVRDPKDPTQIIDALSAFAIMSAADGAKQVLAGTNTTIGCILTNGKLTKPQANHIADMSHDGLARAIDPVHTAFDGDAVFCMSSGEVETNPDLIGILAPWVMEEAIHDAVISAVSAYGLPSSNDIIN